MNAKIQEVDGMRIDYSKSSIEVFPKIHELDGSGQLYFKFSRNRVRTLEIEHHAELIADFDLCLIDRAMNETMIQLFAIFRITAGGAAMNDRRFLAAAVRFGRSMIETEIEKRQLLDGSGNRIELPQLDIASELLAV